MSERKDYYKILSLDRSADVRDIKRVRASVLHTRCCPVWPRRRARCQAYETLLRCPRWLCRHIET